MDWSPSEHHASQDSTPVMSSESVHQQGQDMAGTSVSGYSSQRSQSGLSPIPTSKPPKKRPGPKRDERPAPSEKLEKNRQAQRTHRERKELYTKQLEEEVQRLKDMCTETFRERDQAVMDRDRLAEENRILRNQLAAPTSHLSPSDTYAMSDVTRNSSFSAPYADTPPRVRKVETSVPDSHLRFQG